MKCEQIHLYGVLYYFIFQKNVKRLKLNFAPRTLPAGQKISLDFLITNKISISESSKLKEGMEAEVRIFTLNCWGLGLGISKHRDERMEDIGKYISENDFDIVFLQVC